MADPLSITTGVFALLSTCLHVSLQLKDFYDGAAMADMKVKALLTDVESFARVLETMKATFEQEKIQSTIQTTGHIGSHWSNLSASIKDGQVTLAQLETKLIKVNKTVSVLDAARKHMRMKSATEEILMYQQQIRSYRDTLQLSLQTIMLWNQVTFQESTDQILPGLDELYKEIKRLAYDFNTRMSSMQSLVESNSSSSPSEDANALLNLQNTVQSAASVVSSASTVLGADAPQDPITDHGSDFGDCFPSKPSESMLRWISSNRGYEFEEDQETLGDAGSRAGTFDEYREDPYNSDSDGELEAELYQALLKEAKDKLAQKDGKGAESVVRNCLAKIPGCKATNRVALKFEILLYLVTACLMQKDFDGAQSAMRERMPLHSHHACDGKPCLLSDTLIMSHILISQKSYPEAMLYARRALKGYRRLEDPAGDGAKRALRLLIRICHEQGNFDEERAYKTILADVEIQQASNKPEPPNVGGSSSASGSTIVNQQSLQNLNINQNHSFPSSTEETVLHHRNPQSVASNISYQANVARQKTKKWAEAKIVDYGGEDWGDEDEYDYGSPPPPPVSKPAGLQQLGQAVQASSSVNSPVVDNGKRHGDLPPALVRTAENPSTLQRLQPNPMFEKSRYVLVIGSEGCGKTDFLWSTSFGASTEVEFAQFRYRPTYGPQCYKIVSSHPHKEPPTRLSMNIQENTRYEIWCPDENDPFNREELVIICFDIGNRKSFTAVLEYFNDHDRHNFMARMILVGLKKDLRTDPETVSRLFPSGRHAVTVEQAQSLAAKRGILYLECSTTTGQGLKNTWQAINDFALEMTTPLKLKVPGLAMIGLGMPKKEYIIKRG